MPADDEGRLRAFLSARAGELRRTAYLLTGDAATARALLEDALAQLAARWDEVDHDGDPESFVLHAMAARLAGGRLRRPWRPLAASVQPVDTAAVTQAREGAPDVDEDPRTRRERLDREQRERVWSALDRVDRRHRVLLVLDGPGALSDDDLAEVLGCSLRGLDRRRDRALGALHVALRPAVGASG